MANASTIRNNKVNQTGGKMVKKSLLCAVLVGIFLAGTSYAQDPTDQGNSAQGQSSGEEHSHRAPSQAAIDACSGTCDYTNSRGEDKSGTCANTSDGQTLFCKRSKRVSS
jgi:hypothetical protein